MKLDFSKLNAIRRNKPPKRDVNGTELKVEVKVPTSPIKTPKTATEGKKEVLPVYRKLQREQDEYKRLVEAYGTYQQHIKMAGDLRTQILKGSGTGEPATALLLKAVQCISLMTGDMLFSEQVKSDLITIYGKGLLESVPIEWEIDEVKGRLSKLQQAVKIEANTDNKKRMGNAIQAHIIKLEELERLKEKAEEQKHIVEAS